MAERLGQKQASPPRTESDPRMETNVLLRKHSPSKNIRVKQIRFMGFVMIVSDFERHGQTRDCPHPTLFSSLLYNCFFLNNTIKLLLQFQESRQ